MYTGECIQKAITLIWCLSRRVRDVDKLNFSVLQEIDEDQLDGDKYLMIFFVDSNM